MACDVRMIAPTLYQVLFPRTFRTTEIIASPLLSAIFGGRRQTDNAPFAFHLPHEDEFAICSLSMCSPYAGLAFPRRKMFYRRYVKLENTSPSELDRWRAALRSFVAKFAGGTGRIPLLKSPTHTCRVRLLMDLFPGARFLHIHRHPCAVYQSRRAELIRSSIGYSLQSCTDDPEDEIVAVYREMHEALFRDRLFVPQGRYHEVAYEELVREPLATLRGAYHHLGLGDFEKCAGTIQGYIDSLGVYEKNRHPPLPESTRCRLATEWRRSFEEWGYAP
jgi:omega-hydroxy-beta-dihydromenaquinone-9 sulfotransferase